MASSPAASAQRPFPPKEQYLLAYNSVSLTLWAFLLFRLFNVLPLGSASALAPSARYIQTLALLEILHSATKIVRSPLPTTALQVASRVVLVWGVCYNFPAATEQSPFYISMLAAWSLSEVIRYGFFVYNLGMGQVPGWLQWLRYNAFFVLYPVGISSECACVYNASMVAKEEWVRWGFWGVLGVYVPGSYILYTHMMAQRRRVMRGKEREKRQD